MDISIDIILGAFNWFLVISAKIIEKCKVISRKYFLEILSWNFNIVKLRFNDIIYVLDVFFNY